MSPSTRVVILTAMVQPDVVAQALEAGCVGVLAKDTSIREIAEAIHTVHAGGTVFAPDALAGAVDRLRRPTVDELSDRELQVLELVARGTPTAVIAEELFLSVHTVRNHVRRITEKLGVHSKLEAVTEGARRGLLRLD